jgi:dienelactone hydrolase
MALRAHWFVACQAALPTARHRLAKIARPAHLTQLALAGMLAQRAMRQWHLAQPVAQVLQVVQDRLKQRLKQGGHGSVGISKSISKMMARTTKPGKPAQTRANPVSRNDLRIILQGVADPALYAPIKGKHIMKRRIAIALCGWCLLATQVFAADNNPAMTPVQLKAADGVSVYGETWAAATPRATIVLFHQAGSNRGEYATIAPRLVQAGYSVLAIDQRSGGKLFGRDNETVKKLGKSGKYLEALPDLEAALAFALKPENGKGKPVLVWGSSYSASLVLLLAGQHPDQIAAVLSFSPGEYLGQQGMVQAAAAKVSVPTFITSARDGEEVSTAKAIFDDIPAKIKQQFIPKIAGVHGSSTLLADRNPKGKDENWAAVLAFLQGLKL